MLSLFSFIRRLILGKPLSSNKVEHTLLPKILALPVFASDAISSVAYATQQILLALGGAGLWIAAEHDRYSHYTLVLASLIVMLLIVVVLSYWQTIFAYPNGGGSYIVSKDNLGSGAGLVAAAALLIDYVLTVSVSIASGVQNLSDIPFVRAWHLDQHLVLWCLLSIAGLTIANLRGLKESGALFAIFTYGFVFFAYALIFLGIVGPFIGWHFDYSEIHEVMQTHPQGVDQARQAAGTFGLFVLLHAFANGCCAMTGTEAVSNGIPAFQENKSRNAALTLVAMAVILGTLFLGISYLAVQFHVVYWESDGKFAPAVIDQISGAVFGKSGSLSWAYLATQFFTSTLLLLAANTSYADFPRLASILARDKFLPKQLSSLGDKLVFHNGILLLGIFASLLIVMKNGSVDALIPLYALGVFTAFTLSQTGMVVHWFKSKEAGWGKRAVFNGIGAAATFIVLIDIAVEKFTEGAWIIIILIGCLVFLFRAISNHYDAVSAQLRLPDGTQLAPLKKHKVIVFLSGLHRGIIPALEYGRSLSEDCVGVYVEIEPGSSDSLRRQWAKWDSGVPLVVLASPFRSILRPINRYLDAVVSQHKNHVITVIIPEFVPLRGWHALLHGQTGLRLKLALLRRRDVIVSNVRYFLTR